MPSQQTRYWKDGSQDSAKRALVPQQVSFAETPAEKAAQRDMAASGSAPNESFLPLDTSASVSEFAFNYSTPTRTRSVSPSCFPFSSRANVVVSRRLSSSAKEIKYLPEGLYISAFGVFSL